MKAQVQIAFIKALDDLFSAKFFALVAATALLATGKLNENNWVAVVMMIAGLKEAGSIVSTIRSGPQNKGVSNGTGKLK